MYERQQYDDCVRSIAKGKRERLTPGEEAELMLVEAMCREEMHQWDQADKLYRELSAKYANTQFAQRGKERMAFMEADQREHFDIDFAPGSWGRVAKHWNGERVFERYTPSGRTDGYSREMIVIIAKDIRSKNFSVSDALAEVKAFLELEAKQMTFSPRDESAGQAFFEFNATNPGEIERTTDLGEIQMRVKIRRGTGVGRVLVTKTRMQVVYYSTTAFQLDEKEKNRWVGLLANAHLVDAMDGVPGKEQKSR
jgi:hypothetical protein